MPFRGTSDQKLDVKNRLTIPARHRKELEGELVLAVPLDQKPCLWVWRADAYDVYSAAVLAELSPLSEKYFELERLLNSYASDIELDSAGRVMIPPRHMAYAKLAKDVVVVGAGRRLELWDPDAWNDHQPALLHGAGEITRAAGHAG
ncbi:MAG TPA: division/cell wall cluster transcriptional repressor MraZ [Solirubrobacteraceae bacterium]|nr:division/cell wall cluster transcriptional repressor MraZ [Solirubrobacteraceae bacterium]